VPSFKKEKNNIRKIREFFAILKRKNVESEMFPKLSSLSTFFDAAQKYRQMTGLYREHLCYIALKCFDARHYRPYIVLLSRDRVVVAILLQVYMQPYSCIFFISLFCFI